MGLPDRQRSLTIYSAAWIQSSNVTDRQTDTGRQHRTRLRIASLGKNNQSINQLTNQSINQTINQSIDRSIDRLFDWLIEWVSDLWPLFQGPDISRSIDRSIIDKFQGHDIHRSIDRSIHQSINQSINQPINQPINQTIIYLYQTNGPYHSKNR